MKPCYKSVDLQTLEEKKNVRMLEKSTVIWNSYLRSENSSYWKGSRLQVVGFIPPAIDTVKPQMWWTLWKINSVDILYCMKLKKLFCMDTDLAEHLNYFLGAATCKKNKRINQPFSTVYIIFKNKFH